MFWSAFPTYLKVESYLHTAHQLELLDLEVLAGAHWSLAQGKGVKEFLTETLVSVDEGITPLASASKPDLPISRHPAPQSPDPLARTVPRTEEP